MSQPDDQGALFELTEFDWWREHWDDMPEYENTDQTSYKQIVIHFATPEDMQEFAKLVGQTVTDKTQSLWYPKAEIGRYVDKRYIVPQEEPTDAPPDRTPGFDLFSEIEG